MTTVYTSMYSVQLCPWICPWYKYILTTMTYLYNYSTYSVCTSMYWVHTQYILSTYSVQDYALAIPRLQCSSEVAVLLLCLLWSTNTVHTWYGTVLQWYVLQVRYCMKPLVLLCSCTYLLVMHVTILRISTFWFGTWYIQICTTSCTVQIWVYQVPNQNVESSGLWHALQGGMYSYRAVQGVLYDTRVCTIAALCQLSTYLFVLAIP